MNHSPPGSGFVLIVGPDGAGKSTVLDAIAARAASRRLPLSRAHCRPGVLAAGRTGGAPVTDPHGRPPRAVPASLAKLLLTFADHVVGGATRWRAARRDGLLVLERGWFDMLVDQRRYRIPVRLSGFVRVLGRLVPRPDVVLLLAGDPVTLHARKPEIGVAEVGRQIERWREVAPAAGRRVIEVDTVTMSPEEVADRLFRDLEPDRDQASWRTIALTPARLAMRRTGQAGPALALYQPQTRTARAASAVQGIAGRGRRAAEPLAGLDELFDRIGIRPSGVASMRSSTPGRLILGTCRGDRLDTVVKIGALDDDKLRHEALMMAEPLHAALALERPGVRWSGEWRDHFVLATAAAQRSSSAPWTVEEVLPLALGLAQAGVDGAPLIHGDFAPWNLLRTGAGPVLLDWESARWGDEPLHDLAHFVVAEGALLGRYAPDRAVSLLCEAGSPGRRLLHALHRDELDARKMLEGYLEQSRPTEPRARRYTWDMLKLVNP